MHTPHHRSMNITKENSRNLARYLLHLCQRKKPLSAQDDTRVKRTLRWFDLIGNAKQSHVGYPVKKKKTMVPFLIFEGNYIVGPDRIYS